VKTGPFLLSALCEKCCSLPIIKRELCLLVEHMNENIQLEESITFDTSMPLSTNKERVKQWIGEWAANIEKWMSLMGSWPPIWAI